MAWLRWTPGDKDECRAAAKSIETLAGTLETAADKLEAAKGWVDSGHWTGLTALNAATLYSVFCNNVRQYIAELKEFVKEIREVADKIEDAVGRVATFVGISAVTLGAGAGVYLITFAASAGVAGIPASLTGVALAGVVQGAYDKVTSVTDALKVAASTAMNFNSKPGYLSLGLGTAVSFAVPLGTGIHVTSHKGQQYSISNINQALVQAGLTLGITGLSGLSAKVYLRGREFSWLQHIGFDAVTGAVLGASASAATQWAGSDTPVDIELVGIAAGAGAATGGGVRFLLKSGQAVWQGVPKLFGSRAVVGQLEEGILNQQTGQTNIQMVDLQQVQGHNGARYDIIQNQQVYSLADLEGFTNSRLADLTASENRLVASSSATDASQWADAAVDQLSPHVIDDAINAGHLPAAVQASAQAASDAGHELAGQLAESATLNDQIAQRAVSEAALAAQGVSGDISVRLGQQISRSQSLPVTISEFAKTYADKLQTLSQTSGVGAAFSQTSSDLMHDTLAVQSELADNTHVIADNLNPGDIGLVGEGDAVAAARLKAAKTVAKEQTLGAVLDTAYQFPYGDFAQPKLVPFKSQLTTGTALTNQTFALPGDLLSQLGPAPAPQPGAGGIPYTGPAPGAETAPTAEELN